MRKLVVGFAVSLDGYIEGPNAEFDWITIDPEIDFSKQMKRFDTFFLGRKTYEMVLPMGSKALGNTSVYVFSKTLERAEPPFQLVKEDMVTFITNMKSKKGKDIAIYGGADLLTTLLNLGVVDEISLSVIPVMIGAGKHFVGLLNKRIHLKYKSSETFGNGTIILNYDVINE